MTLDFYTNFDLWVEAFSLIIALVIAGFSARVFFITKQKRHLIFSTAFLAIAAGIFSRVVFDYFIAFEQLSIPLKGFIALSFRADLVFLFSMLCILTGYLLIFIVNEYINHVKVALMLLLLAPITILAAHYFYIIYHLVNLVLVSFLFSHFNFNYRKHRTTNTLLIMLAFAAILISEFFFLFMTFSSWPYFVGNVLRLAGFILFLAALIRIYTK